MVDRRTNQNRWLLRLTNTVKREQQIIVILAFENDIFARGKRIMDTLRDQCFIAPRDVFAELRGSIHLVPLRQIRADAENTAIADTGAAQGRVLGCQRGSVEQLHSPMYFERRIYRATGFHEQGDNIVRKAAYEVGTVFLQYRDRDSLRIQYPCQAVQFSELDGGYCKSCHVDRQDCAFP